MLRTGCVLLKVLRASKAAYRFGLLADTDRCAGVGQGWRSLITDSLWRGAAERSLLPGDANLSSPSQTFRQRVFGWGRAGQRIRDGQVTSSFTVSNCSPKLCDLEPAVSCQTVIFSPDACKAALVYGDCLELHDLLGSPSTYVTAWERLPISHNDRLPAAVWSTSSRQLAFANSVGQVQVSTWPLLTTSVSQELYSERLICLQWSCSCTLVAWTAEGTLHFLDEACTLLSASPLIDFFPRKFQFSPTGSILLGIQKSRMHVFQDYSSKDAAIIDMSVSGQDRGVVLFRDITWASDSHSFAIIVLLDVGGPNLMPLAAVPKQVYVLVYSVETLMLQSSFEVQNCSWLAWRPGCYELALSGPDMIRTASPRDGATVVEMPPVSGFFCKPSWSPDGRHVAVGRSDGIFMVYNGTTGVLEYRYAFQQHLKMQLGWDIKVSWSECSDCLIMQGAFEEGFAACLCRFGD